MAARGEAGAEAAVRSALDGQLPVAVEVVLFKNESESGSVLVELCRFNEKGERSLRFRAGQVQLPNGEKHEVIRRSASMAGMQRMLSADPELVEDELVIVESGDSPGGGSSGCRRASGRGTPAPRG